MSLRSGVSPVVVLLSCAVLLAPLPTAAVNLVPNPSFELYSSCPTGFSQFFQTVA